MSNFWVNVKIEFVFWNENSAKDDVELPYSILVLHAAAAALPEPHDIEWPFNP